MTTAADCADVETITAIKSALFEQQHRTVLVQGGPGSGKTFLTVDLALEAALNRIGNEQRVLVLTFSVSAVDQIAAAMRKATVTDRTSHARVEITNYHSFYKGLLDAYGRFSGVPRAWRTWQPHEVEASLISLLPDALDTAGRADTQKMWELSNATSITAGKMDAPVEYVCRPETLHTATEFLAQQHGLGLLHYDAWPHQAHRILAESAILRQHIGRRYPFVFIDEFQDTTGIEWEFIRELSRESVLVCMADRNQAVYLWRGAHPETRLQRLRQERCVENPEGFELRGCPRSARNPALAAFAQAVRTACASAPPPGGLLTWHSGAVEVRGVPKHKREAAREAGWEYPKAYAAHIKAVLRRPDVRNGRAAILCPTWALLAAVSDALRKSETGPPRHHVTVGLEGEVGAFLAAMAHAFSGRVGTTSKAESLALCDLSLDHIRRVSVGQDYGKTWFGSSSEDLSVQANRRRRDRIRAMVTKYAEGGGNVAAAVSYLPELARDIRKVMSGDRASIWMADHAFEGATRRWYSMIDSFIERNTNSSASEVTEAIWRSVEACVAWERRMIWRAPVLLMTAHAAKGKEFDCTIVCGVSQGTRHMHAHDQSQCDDVRNILHVACSRSREKLVILHKKGKPSCVLSRLNGDPCHLGQPCPANEAGVQA